MAHWMKYWATLIAVGCGLIALWLLPPDPPRGARNYVPPTEAQEVKLELRREAERLNGVLKRLHWLDSLTHVFADAQPDENGVIVSFPVGIDAATAKEVRAVVAREIDRLEIKDTEYVLAVARPNGHSGNHEAFGLTVRTLQEFYALRGGDPKVCLTLRPYAGSNPQNALWRYGWSPNAGASNILGPCAYYLLYGTPGPAIETWLSSGAAQFGVRHAKSRDPFADPETSSLARIFLRVGNRAPFGIRRSVRYPGAHDCLAGDEQACRNSVLDAKRPVSLRLGDDLPAFLHRDPSGGAFYSFEESLFYDLEQEFGRERFTRFWTSDQDVETAFQAAFGVPIGEWVMGWAQARLGTYRMGPMPSLEAILISLGVISFFLTIAIAMSKKRKVA